MATKVVQRGARFLERLNTREKVLLLLMLILFGTMGTAVFLMNFNSSLDDLETEIGNYERALTQLAQQHVDFAERLAQAEEIEAKLANNELQLRGFLERECLAAGVERPSSYSDNVIPQRDASGSANIVEHETRASITAVDPLPLSRLLNSIARSEELVVLKVIDLQPARGQLGRYRVELTVSTYRYETPDS